MGTNERLFYNRFKYRVRFILRRGVSLLRTCYQYDSETAILDALNEMREREKDFQNTPTGFTQTGYGFKSIWSLDAREVEALLKIFAYRQQFDMFGKIRVESPMIDFYTNEVDYIKKAEDTGLNAIEFSESLTDEPNVIITDKLPYGIYNLKCITKYTWVPEDVVEALLNYQEAGEIRFPWTWETRRMYVNRSREKPLPEYIYALNEESITMLNLMAGNVINQIYTYRIV
jgi:hypothetical protein